MELAKEIEKYKDRVTFKESEYKKSCKAGSQKRGEGASNLKLGGLLKQPLVLI